MQNESRSCRVNKNMWVHEGLGKGEEDKAMGDEWLVIVIVVMMIKFKHCNLNPPAKPISEQSCGYCRGGELMWRTRLCDER